MEAQYHNKSLKNKTYGSVENTHYGLSKKRREYPTLVQRLAVRHGFFYYFQYQAQLQSHHNLVSKVQIQKLNKMFFTKYFLMYPQGTR